MSRINVVFCFDECHSKHLPAIIATLVKNNKSLLSFFFITSAPASLGVGAAKKILTSLGHECEIIKIDISQFSDFKEMRNFKYSVYFRLLIPSLIKRERVIYLDTDIYVNDDLSELFNSDLQGKEIGVIQDEFVDSPEDEEKNLFDLRGGPYFNSGVIVWDLTKADKKNFFKKCAEAFAPNEYRIRFGDQCLLNIVMDERKTLLSNKWNKQIHLRDLSLEELQSITEKKGLFHFCSTPKPWDCNLDNGLGLFWKKYVFCNSI
jgi:hypothetical protein